MRFAVLTAFLLSLLTHAAWAQSTAPAKAAAPPAASAPAVSAIIPGSPLAALTGGSSSTTSADDGDTPFGTESLGFSVAGALGDEATRTVGEFTSAVRQSTRLTPVLDWLGSFSSQPHHRAEAWAILMGIVIAFLPGVAVDLGMRFLLRHPLAACARRAVSVRAGQEEAGWRVALLVLGRRALLAVLAFALSLLPLAGFAVAEQLLISAGVLGTRPAHLAVIGIDNAYLTIRAAQELLRFLFNPVHAALRLVVMPDARAVRVMSRFRILLATIFFGYCLVSVTEILGLSGDGGKVLIRLVSLAGHVEVAVFIWQGRGLVGRWIAGDPEATGFFPALRRRFGSSWHYFALFYVLALWTAWAGGVHNAFIVLLRVVLVLVAATLLGRLGWVGSSMLLERTFPDADAGSTKRHQVFFTRARAYNPLIRGLFRAVIGMLVLLLVLQGWGVDAFGWLLTDQLSRALLNAFFGVVVTIVVALVLWEAANYALNNRVDRLAEAGRVRQASRLRTLLPMLRAAIGTLIFIATLFICLAKIGVNTTGLLAVSSVVGIAIGFGSQKLVQDIITGLFLLLEDAMQVGDVVTLGGMSGTVERLSIRTIRLRGGDGSVNIIPFSAVTTVTNQTRDFGYAQISITIGTKEDVGKVIGILREIGKQMRTEPAWHGMMRDDVQIFGLDEFGTKGAVITGQIRTGPGQHWSVKREFYGRVQKCFVAEGIEFPDDGQTLKIDMPQPVEARPAGEN